MQRGRKKMGLSDKSQGDPYENLANAIIMQAVADYRAAKRKLRRLKPGGQAAADARREMEKFEQFVMGPVFGKLTSLDPEYLLFKLWDEQ